MCLFEETWSNKKTTGFEFRVCLQQFTKIKRRRRRRTSKFLLSKTFFLNEASFPWCVQTRTPLPNLILASIPKSIVHQMKFEYLLYADVNAAENHSLIKLWPLINHIQYYSMQTQFDGLTRCWTSNELLLGTSNCCHTSYMTQWSTHNDFPYFLFRLIKFTESNFLHRIRHFN